MYGFTLLEIILTPKWKFEDIGLCNSRTPMNLLLSLREGKGIGLISLSLHGHRVELSRAEDLVDGVEITLMGKQAPDMVLSFSKRLDDSYALPYRPRFVQQSKEVRSHSLPPSKTASAINIKTLLWKMR